MSQYFERLLMNGFLVVMCAFVLSPVLIASCIAVGITAFYIWAAIHVVLLVISGFINPESLWSDDDDYTPEYR